MRGKGFQSSKNKARSGVESNSGGFSVKKFIGLSLAGGKSDKTSMAVIEYYPKQKKIFLSELHKKIKSEGNVSADQNLHELISTRMGPINSMAFNVPLALPKCMRCRLKCPGYEICKEPEIRWLWKHYNARNTKKKPLKLFTPYTERCAEFFIAHYLEEIFYPDHALGANLAPLVARAQFIKKRLKIKSLEVYPRLSLWRIGRSLGVQKSYLRFHKHSVEGTAIRKAILERLSDMNVAFLYSQDMKLMINNAHAFDAFICALTAVLNFVKQCEGRPKDFPKKEPWVHFPVKDINWNFLDFK